MKLKYLLTQYEFAILNYKHKKKQKNNTDKIQPIHKKDDIIIIK